MKFLVGDLHKEVDVNARIALCAAMVMGVIGPCVFIVQPGFVQGLVQYMGFSEKQAGYIAAAEMAGIALVTVVMTFISHRLVWRRVFAISLLLIIAANLACAATADTAAFTLLRFLAGMGSGGLVSLSFATIGLTRDPDRNFGYYIMWVLVYGALGLLLMPTAYHYVGMDGFLVFLAVFAACGLPFVRFLPVHASEQVQVEEDAVQLDRSFTAAALAAMFCYFLAQGVVWAYLFLIGTNGGGSEQGVANALTLSQFLGIAGALTAALVGARFGRSWPLTLGILGAIVPLAFLFGQMGITIYAVAVCVYNYAWNLTHPYLLASMASFDRQGRVVVYAVAFQMLGLAFGPALAATVIATNDYSNALWLGMLLFAASLVFILPPVYRQRRLAMAAV